MEQPAERAISYMRELRDDCQCREYAAVKGYRVIGVVLDPDGSRIQALQDGVIAGEAEVILTCSRRLLPADRLPRIESVTQELPPFPAEETLRLPRFRRTRRRTG